jgi:hypothetical protein
MSRLAKKLLAVALGATLACGIAAAVVWLRNRPSAETREFLELQARLDALRPEADRHRVAVLASLTKSSGEPWSGAYAWSNGYESIEFDIGPAGFYYERGTDYGPFTVELAYGTIASVEGALIRLRIDEDLIVLPGEIANDEAHSGRRRFRLTDAVYSIPWDAERFLVPAELMQDFCSLAKATGYYSMTLATYPCKVRPGTSTWGPHRDTPLAGLPDVPSEFQRFLPE